MIMTSVSSIIGISSDSHSLREFIQKIGPKDINLLITGETGTGKELVARAIHDASPRRTMPFVAVNCAGIPETLIESELFGHERGSFTGAHRDREGKFVLANGGTLFLDEIGDASLGLQAKLLRALQEREVMPLGSKRIISVDIRIITATNKDLPLEIKAGRFRSDFYYRICVDHIFIPPLRERPEDIPLLAEYFLSIFRIHHGLDIPKRISPDAIKILQCYSWPGNIRELANLMERIVCHADEDYVLTEHLPKFLFNTDNDMDCSDEALKMELKKFFKKGKEQLMEHMEKTLIEIVLQETRGNKQRTAKLLGCALNTLKSKISRYKVSSLSSEKYQHAGR